MVALRSVLSFRSSLGFRRQRVLRGLDELIERTAVGRSQVGEDLAIDFNLGRLEAFDEAGIGQAGRTGTGVDAGLPESTVLPLLQLPVMKRVLEAVSDGVFRVAEELGALESIAFRGCQGAAAAAA